MEKEFMVALSASHSVNTLAQCQDHFAQNVSFGNNRVNCCSGGDCPIVTQGGEISLEQVSLLDV